MNQFQYQQGQAQQYGPQAVIDAPAERRAKFIVRTYNHLFLSILAFAGLEVAIFKSGVVDNLAPLLFNNWLAVIGLFIVASWGASHVAHRVQSKAAQYAALIGFVFVESIVFVPLLYIADMKAPGAIRSAAVVTMLGFTGLTAIAFITRKDFSFLRGFLMWAGVVALVLIVASLIFGFALGTIFSVAMVGLAGAAILYDTSNVLHHYPEDRYVGAALELFSSVALMFWYVLRILPRETEATAREATARPAPLQLR